MPRTAHRLFLGFLCFLAIAPLPFVGLPYQPLAAMVFQVGQYEPAPAPTETPHSDGPNIILVLTDDQEVASLEFMPHVQELLVEQGTTFTNAFVNNPLCCPSRASILRGQYVHNHGVLDNHAPHGGWQKFYAAGEGPEKSTIATWLQDSGYRTAMIGKYLNGYKRSYIPHGWDEWYVRTPTAYDDEHTYYEYTLNQNGQLVKYGHEPEDYITDVLSDFAVDFVERSAGDPAPFFLHLTPNAPHDPKTPAPRHMELFPNERAPRPPSFAEKDVSDKPAYVQRRPRYTQGYFIDPNYRQRLRALQAVDEMIARLIATLESTGQLENTYIVFASDNGWMMGQHRITWTKWVPYEESIRVPMVVRGPGVPVGVRDHLVLNVDLAPTLAELAGAAVPDFVDGRSLLPLLTTTPLPNAAWRQAFPFENRGLAGFLQLPSYQGFRTRTYKYVEYATGERELYDLVNDPYELENQYATSDPATVHALEAYLDVLRGCAGATCRAVDVAGLPVVPTRVPSSTPTATSTRTPTPTKTPTRTRTPTKTPTQTRAPTKIPTLSSTPTATSTASGTPALTPTTSSAPALTPTPSSTPLTTPTSSSTPVGTPTPTGTRMPALTPSSTPTTTATSISTPTTTATSISTLAASPTSSSTPVASPMPISTPIETPTPNSTPAPTSTSTRTSTSSRTPVASSTGTALVASTGTPTRVATATTVPTRTPSPTTTWMPSPTATRASATTVAAPSTPAPTGTATSTVAPSSTPMPGGSPTTTSLATETPAPSATRPPATVEPPAATATARGSRLYLPVLVVRQE